MLWDAVPLQTYTPNPKSPSPRMSQTKSHLHRLPALRQHGLGLGTPELKDWALNTSHGGGVEFLEILSPI